MPMIKQKWKKKKEKKSALAIYQTYLGPSPTPRLAKVLWDGSVSYFKVYILMYIILLTGSRIHYKFSKLQLQLRRIDFFSLLTEPCLQPAGPLLSYHIFDHHSSESSSPNECVCSVCSTDLLPEPLYRGTSKPCTLLNTTSATQTFSIWTKPIPGYRVSVSSCILAYCIS